MFVVGRLLLCYLCVFVLLVLSVTENGNVCLVYDHQTLLDLRFLARDLVKLDFAGQNTLPRFFRDPCPPFRRKCSRRCGWLQSLEPVDSWLVPVVGFGEILQPCVPLLSLLPQAWGES